MLRRALSSSDGSAVRGVFLATLLATAAVAACSSGSAPTTFDLTAPRGGARGGGVAGAQIVVNEPVSIQALEADRIIVKDAAGSVSFVSGGQWADRLPRLVQARLIQTFENTSRMKAVSRPGDRVSADYLLNTDIRAFQIAAGSGEAVVEISAKLVNDKSGRIATARVFSARVPVAGVDAASAARGLDQALSRVLLEIVRWAGSGAPAV
jgi:cholesterol transport system auxiliary component